MLCMNTKSLDSHENTIKSNGYPPGPAGYPNLSSKYRYLYPWADRYRYGWVPVGYVIYTRGVTHAKHYMVVMPMLCSELSNCT